MFRRAFNPFMAAVAAALSMQGKHVGRAYDKRVRGSIGSMYSNTPRTRPNPKYPRAHQGEKECRRRLRQDFRKAHPYSPIPAELAA